MLETSGGSKKVKAQAKAGREERQTYIRSRPQPVWHNYSTQSRIVAADMPVVDFPMSRKGCPTFGYGAFASFQTMARTYRATV
jgi:hypothetical protein